jgi:hypothetical protein
MADAGIPEDTDRATTRYEVVLRAGVGGGDEIDMRRVADLDLDCVPDPGGGVRMLVNMDEADRLVESGFVTIVRAAPSGPLDPSLIMGNTTAAAWLEE